MGEKGAKLPDIVDLEFVARRYGLNRAAVRRLAQRGKLPGAFKAAGVWRVRLDALKSQWDNGRVGV